MAKKKFKSTYAGITIEFDNQAAKENFDRDPEKMLNGFYDLFSPRTNGNNKGSKSETHYCFFSLAGKPVSEADNQRLLTEMIKEANERGVTFEEICVEWQQANKIDKFDEESQRRLDEAAKKSREQREREMDEERLDKLELYFVDRPTASRFLNQARGMKNTEIIMLVKKYEEKKLCTSHSKGLWELLYPDIYKSGYGAWNKCF